jgi:hypothetical protein
MVSVLNTTFYDYQNITRTILLFENQYIWFSVTFDDERNCYNVRVNFDDYCSIKLRNTSGLDWSFMTEELAWAFAHSDYVINLNQVFRGVFKAYYTSISNEEDLVKKTRIQNLYLKLGAHLKCYKSFDTILNLKGQYVSIPDSAKLTFVAKLQFGSVNYGSHEYQFELRLISNSTYSINFKSWEIAKIHDINEPYENIIFSFEAQEFQKLIKARIESLKDDLSQTAENDLNTYYIFLEFLNQC